MKSIDTLILAGGKSSRLTNLDKLEIKIEKDTILDLVINDAINNIYVVGNERKTKKKVTWVKDLTNDGGPGVGVWSGVQKIQSEYVLILAGDQPFIGPFIRELCEKALGNGSWLVNKEGIGQPLASCIKTSVLKTALEESQGVNTSLSQLLGKMNLVAIEVENDVVQDLDTWADVIKVTRERGSMTDAWLKNIAQKLEISHENLDIDKILDLTRDVAHNIERKAAPLTTFLLGYAAGKDNATKEQIQKLITKINESIDEWKK